MGSWRTAEPTTRLQDTLLRGPEEGKSWESGWGGGGYKAWQSRAVAPFTVVVNLEINGDTVLKTSEGKLHCCGREFYTGQNICFPFSAGLREPLRFGTRRFLFKCQEHKESHSDMLTHTCCTNSVATTVYPSGTDRLYN